MYGYFNDLFKIRFDWSKCIVLHKYNHWRARTNTETYHSDTCIRRVLLVSVTLIWFYFPSPLTPLSISLHKLNLCVYEISGIYMLKSPCKYYQFRSWLITFPSRLIASFVFQVLLKTFNKFPMKCDFSLSVCYLL